MLKNWKIVLTKLRLMQALLHIAYASYCWNIYKIKMHYDFCEIILNASLRPFKDSFSWDFCLFLYFARNAECTDTKEEYESRLSCSALIAHRNLPAAAAASAAQSGNYRPTYIEQPEGDCCKGGQALECLHCLGTTLPRSWPKDEWVGEVYVLGVGGAPLGVCKSQKCTQTSYPLRRMPNAVCRMPSNP